MCWVVVFGVSDVRVILLLVLMYACWCGVCALLCCSVICMWLVCVAVVCVYDVC